MASSWWKDAIIYGIDVERFCDGNGDGIGDFQGLSSKVPYLAELGITCVWLLPFYPSTNRDNGYDITDYLRVDSRYGQFEDFLAFLHGAGEHSIRVIVDLVTQHTSNHHPWFQAARRDEESRYRDYYIWTHHPPPVAPGRGPMFPGEESSVWTYDEVARAYYHHRFYHYEPGLNPDNADVREEIERVMDYWLSFGISGFRIDAASHMIERPLAGEHGPTDPHDILRELFRNATARKSDTMMLGEVDETPEKLRTFFDGGQMNMMFNFLLDNYLLLALAAERAEPIRRGLDQLPAPPPDGQWANFLRNLDEADLERLDRHELDAVLRAFAPKEEMRIFDRGIRRRLAPMLGGNERRLKMAHSLLFSMPGSPSLVYGDEIGMGDDLSQHARNAVRSPMQWTGGRNAGFSTAPKGKLAQPVIEGGPFGFDRVNVEAQRGRPDSLFSLLKQLTRLRRTHGEIGSGACEILDPGTDRVLAHRYRGDGASLVMLHNLAGQPARIDLRLDPGGDRLRSMLDGAEVEIDQGRLRVDLEPYGFRWLSAGS